VEAGPDEGKPSLDVPPGTLSSILKLAGLERRGGGRVTRYMVVVERGKSSWGVHVSDLPGCVVVGETRDEAISLIREAIALHIDGLKRDGLPVPKPISEGEFVDVEAA